MPPVGFEPTISAGERPQTYALDRAATGTGTTTTTTTTNNNNNNNNNQKIMPYFSWSAGHKINKHRCKYVL